MEKETKTVKKAVAKKAVVKKTRTPKKIDVVEEIIDDVEEIEEVIEVEEVNIKRKHQTNKRFSFRRWL